MEFWLPCCDMISEQSHVAMKGLVFGEANSPSSCLVKTSLQQHVLLTELDEVSVVPIFSMYMY